MREQLETYVELLFAGSHGTEDIKQEILQNTLDRYDDLISAGKTPEAAYSLAISGIGDISELLQASGSPAQQPQSQAKTCPPRTQEQRENNRVVRAVAVALFILCPVPLLLLESVWGLCLLLGMVAVATMLMVASGNSRKQEDDEAQAPVPPTPRQRLRGSIMATVNALGLVVYFLVSFATHAWHITWLIFVITAAVNGLVGACMDLKEEN